LKRDVGMFHGVAIPSIPWASGIFCAVLPWLSVRICSDYPTTLRRPAHMGSINGSHWHREYHQILHIKFAVVHVQLGCLPARIWNRVSSRLPHQPTNLSTMRTISIKKKPTPEHQVEFVFHHKLNIRQNDPWVLNDT
jgi:hypothetical protein